MKTHTNIQKISLLITLTCLIDVLHITSKQIKVEKSVLKD